VTYLGTCVTFKDGRIYPVISDWQYENIRWQCEIATIVEENMRQARVNKYVVLKGSIIRESEKAIRFNVCDPGSILDEETFWFPLSQIKAIHRSHNQEEDSIEVADWLIEAKANELAQNGD
jgi:hypothetical protein